AVGISVFLLIFKILSTAINFRRILRSQPTVQSDLERNITTVLTKESVDSIKIGLFAEIHNPTISEIPDDAERTRIEEENLCSICMDEFKPDDKVRILDVCKHIFHEKCVDTWLMERSTMCPNCRLDTRIALGIPIQPDEGESLALETSDSPPTSSESTTLDIPESHTSVGTNSDSQNVLDIENSYLPSVEINEENHVIIVVPDTKLDELDDEIVH
ncbi:hypothetical protein HK096_001839, partial [Nowakowskiella sp. JEL0078]